MGGGRGQVAMEYLFVAGFATVLLVVIIVIAYSQSALFSQDVTASQVQKIGNQLVDAANAVYYAGPPAKRTLTLYFPNLVSNIAIANNSLTFTIAAQGGLADYSLSAQTNMTGTLRPFAGTHVVIVEALPGIVNITDT
jgi:uncharacterized protein (UPF0333 family)